MRRRGGLALGTLVLALGATRAHAGKDALVQAPTIGLPQRGSVAGSLSRLAFGAADLGRGAFSLPLPLVTPGERGPLLASVVPSYSAEGGISEWGLGWQVDLSIRRHRVVGEIDFGPGDGFTSPWGVLARGDDGAYYPDGLRHVLRVEAVGAGWVAITGDGTRYHFEPADAVTTGQGTYAWMLSRVENLFGDQTRLIWERNPSGRAFLSEVRWGGRGQGEQYRLRVAYEPIATTFTSYASGQALVLDRRVSRVSQEVATAGGYVERWRYDLTYQTSETGPAFYLRTLTRRFASGVSEPPVTYDYDLGVEQRAQATLARAPGLDPILAAWGESALEPDRAAPTDLEQDGLVDLERHTDQTLIHQTADGFTIEPLPARTGAEQPLCRPSTSAFNKPRLLARMHADAAEPQVVVTKKLLGNKTRVLVCDRAGLPIHDQQRTGAWELGPTVRLADVDLDQRPDLVRVYPGGVEVLRNASTAPGAIAFAPGPITALSPTVTPEVSWILDVSGDGRVDLVTRHAGGLMVWRGVGGARFEAQGTSAPFVLTSGLPLTGLTTYEMAHGDVDGDGLSDVILTKGQQVMLFTNRGGSFRQVPVPALTGIPWTVGFPVIADLSGTGNEQVVLPDGALGYAVQLTSPSTGLLRRADDGKGTVVRFGYDRVRPTPGVRARHAVLASLTVEASGYDPVTYTYEYAAPVSHSQGHYLVGFGEVQSHAPLLTQRVSFHHDDHVSSLVLGERTLDAREPALERFTRRTLEAAAFHGVAWRRLRAEEAGWRRADGTAEVAERTAYLGYQRELCTTVTEHHGPHGVRREETTLATVAALDPALACVARGQRTTGIHADPSLDFVEELRLDRDDLGRLTHAWQVGPDGDLLIQEVSYDRAGRVATIGSPGRGTSTFQYDEPTGHLRAVIEPDGVVRAVTSRDPITDAIRQARTDRGSAGWASSYAYDELERLARAWDELSGTDADHPARTIGYVYPRAEAPGRILERTLVDGTTGAARQTAELFAADGASLALAAHHADGWALSRFAVTDRALGETRTYRRDSMPDLADLTHDALRAGATLLGVTTTSGAGAELASWSTVQTGVIHERAVTRAILGGELVTEATDSGTFVTRTGAGVDGRARWFEDQAGVVTLYEHDVSGRLRRVHTPDGSHRLEVDAYARPTAIEREGVARIEWDYDPATGLLDARRELTRDGALAQTTRYQRDELGRVIRTIDTVAETGASRTIETRWDGRLFGEVSLPGQLGFATTVVGDGWSRTLARRPDGLPVLTRWSLDGWRAVAEDVEYHASGDPRAVTTTVQDGAGAVLAVVRKEYRYDADGQLAGLWVDGTPVYTTEYDPDGRLVAVRFADDDLRFELDPTTRLRRGYASQAGSVRWDRDPRGLLAAERFEAGGLVRTRAYQHDPRGYLVRSSDEDGEASYGYDASGLIERADDEHGARTITRTASSIDAGGETYPVDGLGRITGRRDLSVKYGPSGSIERAWTADDHDLRFVYDDQGQRVLKTRDGVPVAGYLGDLYLSADRVIEPVRAGGMLVGVLDNGRFRRLLADPRGSRIADAHGLLALATPYGLRGDHDALSEALDYVEKGHDRDLGLVRMGVRDYDPRLGQFWTADPLFLGNLDQCARSPAECNLYGYAKNDPLSFVDPSGLGSDDVEDAVEGVGDIAAGSLGAYAARGAAAGAAEAAPQVATRYVVAGTTGEVVGGLLMIYGGWKAGNALARMTWADEDWEKEQDAAKSAKLSRILKRADELAPLAPMLALGRERAEFVYGRLSDAEFQRKAFVLTEAAEKQVMRHWRVIQDLANSLAVWEEIKGGVDADAEKKTRQKIQAEWRKIWEIEHAAQNYEPYWDEQRDFAFSSSKFPVSEADFRNLSVPDFYSWGQKK